MSYVPKDAAPTVTSMELLLGYVADLELEVDRLRKQAQLAQHEVRGALKRIHALCGADQAAAGGPPPLAEIDQATKQLAAVLNELQEQPGYHPAYDQVVTVAIRSLAEKVFRWQQRLAGAARVALRLDLDSEHMEWFPARLRHILDNLFANALKHRNPQQEEPWVQLQVRSVGEQYELRLTDNGNSVPLNNRDEVFELFYRSAPTRAAGLGVGLAVVKLLVEQSGGTLTVEGGKEQGTTFIVGLPRFDMTDYLT